LEYLASLGVATATPAVGTTRRSASRQDRGRKFRERPQTLRAQAILGLLSGLGSGAIGLLLGGFFGLITHGLAWGLCLAVCTAIGWLISGFLWTFGWNANWDLDRRLGFFKDRIGIGVAIVLAAIAFVLCFCGMLAAVMLSGSDAARAWIRGTLLVIWLIGLLPGAVLAVIRLVREQRQ
jgi:hypothetical protein